MVLDSCLFCHVLSCRERGQVHSACVGREVLRPAGTTQRDLDAPGTEQAKIACPEMPEEGPRTYLKTGG